MILQSVLIILATSEWRTSEKRADTLEALRVPPFNNPGYITGKTLGVGIVLLVLNLLSMLLAAGINLFASDAPFDGLLYLFYGITLSFPAMLFLTGLATLGSSFNGKKEKTYIFDDASIYTQGTKPPERWTSYVSPSPYYGNIIKSCLYKTSGKGNSPAIWTAELPETGRYEIFIYVHPAQPLFKGIPEQYYTLTTKEGIENVTLKIDQNYSCWASIGVYELQAGENSITLSDKGVDPVQMIFADAVKWKLISK